MTAGGSEDSDKGLDARRAALGVKIEHKQAEEKHKSSAVKEAAAGAADYNKSSAAVGFRVSADFLSAVLVGGALGLGLDKIAGISPWGLVLFLLLGFAAGVLNALRSLGRAPKLGGKQGK